jgi:hypothetical protein
MAGTSPAMTGKRHCEERSDEAIQLSFPRLQWIASLRAMTAVCAARCYPRPTNGIFVAMTVMNSTLASSGRLAM